MALNRRGFLGALGAAGAALAGAPASSSASSESPFDISEAYGVLVDLTKCIGCRKCEWACNQENELPNQPLETFEDKSVFDEYRRPDADRYTVVNRFPPKEGDDRPVYAKVQCMHCNDPACRSACIVTAFTKEAEGAVTYDAWRCMGCRYCMVACPFQIPAYEYDNPLTPEVRKCTFCMERIAEEGGVPACVEICPPQCLTFAKRSDLVELAHRRIERHPDEYIDHVYGEHEVGGTSWMYMADRPFTELGFPELPHEAPPRLTETIQHGIFKDFIAPVALFAFLGGIMKHFRPDPEDTDQHEGGGS